MNTHYSDIKLIPVTSPAYIANNRFYGRQYRNNRKGIKKDTFSCSYNDHLRKWEVVMQRVFSLLTQQSDDRILRYCDERNIPRYKEIDFVSQLENGSRIFCELKLKAQFKDDLKDKSSGWTQLNKSLKIATHQYNNLSGLAICIDMSSVYQTEPASDYEVYGTIKTLKDALNIPSEKQTLWIDARVICAFAIEHNLLVASDIAEMKEAYNEFKNPLSVLPELSAMQNNNNAFSVLSQLRM